MTNQVIFIIIFYLALAPKETYYKFGRIAFDRYYIEVRAPWTMLTAFAMGLASIKHFFILNGKYGKWHYNLNNSNNLKLNLSHFSNEFMKFEILKK